MRYLSPFLCLFALVLLLGCSGASNTPTTPLASENETGQIDSLPIIGGTTYEDGSFNALGLMGAYELRISPDLASAELTSMRTPAALGNSWVVSGIGFFTLAPCSNCLKINSLSLTLNKELKINFAISHPFKPGTSSLPPSAANRLDLDIFDLKAVIKPVGATPVTYPLIGQGAYAGVLTQNAGLTTELANLVTDTAALPYVLVVDKNANPSAADWNEFSMGASSFFDVTFDLNTSNTCAFEMYLTMGYGASAMGKSQRLTPTYFNPEFNSKSPWKVVVTPPNGSDEPSMANTWNDMNGTTPWNVKVEVFDWQHGVSSIANPPVNTGDIAFASNVTDVKVEIPGMTNTVPSVSTPASGTGSPADPLVYEVPVMNEKLLGAGEYFGLVKVSDSRVPPSPISGIDHLIDAPDGIQLNNYVIPEFATYQIFKATVVIGNLMPVAQAVATTTTSILDGMSVSFDASASNDPDGTVDTYEWDFNGDGTFGGPEDAYTGASHTPTHAFNHGAGTYNVQLRVIDNLLGQDQLDAPIAVTAGPSKNITLRSGVTIADMACISDTGDILVLFTDKEVHKYNSTLSSGSLLYKFDDYGMSHTTPWKGRIESSKDGYSFVGGFTYSGAGWYGGSYDPDGNSLSGLYGAWGDPANYRLETYITRTTAYPQAIGGLNGYAPGMENYTIDWRFDYSYPYMASAYIASTGLTGPGIINYQYMRGAHCCYSDTETYYLFVVEGDPECRVERGRMDGGNFQSGLAWGTKTDANTGFNDPRDIAIDSDNKVYILDVLSTGDRKIKAFTMTGTSLGAFGTNTSIGSSPDRLVVNWGNNWLYCVMGEKASVFFPPEHPF